MAVQLANPAPPLPFSEIMWCNFKSALYRYRRIVLLTPTLTIGVIAMQHFGLLNRSEWQVRDYLVQQRTGQTTFAPKATSRPGQATADQIVVVTIDEKDIQAVKAWPIPDDALADLLEKIRAQNPRAIGLDLYRDLPVGQGYDRLAKVFATTPNLIGVENIIGDRVKPSPILKAKEQVAIADLVLDDDRYVRRVMLTAIDPKEPDPEKAEKAGLATHVALKYLEADGINLEMVNAKAQQYRLGKALFQPLAPGDAGYQARHGGGYQVLLNWYGNEYAFRRVTMRDVIAGNIPPDLMQGRMVFVGSIAESINDFFSTPYGRLNGANRDSTPGVIVHANIAHQLVESAKIAPRTLVGFSAGQTDIWIVAWSLTGILGCCWLSGNGVRRILRGGNILWITLLISGGLVGATYVAFGNGLILPLSPALAAFIIGVASSALICKQQKLEETNHALTDSLQQLQSTQLQLVQSEKMSTLGQMVSGIGHEINNPINFISGNLTYIDNYSNDLFRLITLYQQKLPADREIQDLQASIDLDYLITDLPKIVRSITEGTARLQDISLSLRTFARGDVSNTVTYQIEEGLDSTLMLLSHRIKADAQRPAIAIVKEYQTVPNIDCYPGQLNQVFMNLIANAIDALEESNLNQNRQYADLAIAPNQITITTEFDPMVQQVTIRIKDNGPGMTESVQARIFEPSFTTKAVGKGTGLGLPISRQIIAEKHQGQLECVSTIGQGTEFVIHLPVAPVA
jgi:adenylate cyclase